MRASNREPLAAAIGEKLLRWVLFGVIFAILPIAFNLLSAVTRQASINLEGLVGRGELLLVSVGIAAAAAGELFGREGRLLRNFRLFVIGMSLIIVCVASLWFADVANAIRVGENIDQQVVALGSSAIFFIAVLNGTCCIVLSELQQ